MCVNSVICFPQYRRPPPFDLGWHKNIINHLVMNARYDLRFRVRGAGYRACFAEAGKFKGMKQGEVAIHEAGVVPLHRCRYAFE
jgi:hypothetical protein